MKTRIVGYMLLLLLPLFRVGETVQKWDGTALGRIVNIHKEHGTHTQAHYEIVWISGRDSGYTVWLYESLIRRK